MPPGSPGFVGDRLREARETRMLTGVALSSLIGMGVSTVSSYEKGHTSPSPDVLELISRVLNFRVEFFLRPQDGGDGSSHHAIFERSRSSATNTFRKRARHYRTWLREIVDYLSQFVKLPDPNVPDILDRLDWYSLSDSQIEQAATDTRRHWNLGEGPISDVTLLAEKNGVIVAMIAMDSRNLDAFSTWDTVDHRPYIMLGNDTQSAFRTRFNVCHEIGHLVLHRGVTPSEFHDRKYFKLIESQANRFASALLTPDSSFSSDMSIPSLVMFRQLKPRWRVSIKMMIHRAQELDIISREDARHFYISYNRRGWNRLEPMDDEYRMEEPRLVRRVVETIVEKGVLERGQIAAALPFNREDVELLANLPYGYLDEDSAYNWAVRELENYRGPN